MTDFPPNALIPIVCPYCGFRLEKEARYLKKHPPFSCPKCKGLLNSHSEEIVKAITATPNERDKIKKLLGFAPRNSDNCASLDFCRDSGTLGDSYGADYLNDSKTILEL
jgi:hypothetical protein